MVQSFLARCDSHHLTPVWAQASFDSSILRVFDAKAVGSAQRDSEKR
jgi:hypothetical protein